MSDTAVPVRDQKLKALLGDERHQVISRDGSGEVFLDHPMPGGRDADPVTSLGFKRYVAHWHRQRYGGRANPKELQALSDDFADHWRFVAAPPRRQVFQRVGEHADALYLDTNNDRRVIEITADGWRHCESAPVSFERTLAMDALPMPEPGGRIEELWGLWPDTLTEQQRYGILGWMLTAFVPSIEHLVLVLTGAYGSGKSTAAEVAQHLTDPSMAGLGGGFTGDDRDLRVAFSNSWVVSFDNLSALSERASDTICQAVTDGCLRARALHTDADEVIRPIDTPVILNGLSNVATRYDLLTRSLVIEVPQLPPASRRDKGDVKAELKRLRPKLLGALLDLLVCGLGTPRRAEYATASRMSGAIAFAERCFEGAGMKRGLFAAGVAKSHAVTAADPLDSWPFAPFLFKRFQKEGEIRAGVLLEQISEVASRTLARRHPDWPKTAAELDRQLQSHIQPLLAAGLRVEQLPENGSDGGGLGKLYRFVPTRSKSNVRVEVVADSPPSATEPAATATPVTTEGRETRSPSATTGSVTDEWAAPTLAPLEAWTAGTPLVGLVKRRGEIRGTPTQLLAELNREAAATPDLRTAADWPRSAVAFGKSLVRMAAALEGAGVSFTPATSRSSGDRLHTLKLITPAPAA